MASRLTEIAVRRAVPPDRGQTIIWDDTISRFGLRLTSSGKRAYVLDYHVGARRRRITIGSASNWTLAAARKAAQELLRQVDLGYDPLAERQAQRVAPTVADLWHYYHQNHLPRLTQRSQTDQRSMWVKDILPALGGHKLVEIHRSDVAALHRKVSQSGRAVRANRIVEVLRAAFNDVIPDWVTFNPCGKIPKNREEQRENYLTPEQLSHLLAALAEHKEAASADAIRLLILTGARRNEVLGARWCELDLEQGVWVKPASRTKQGRVHRVPLSAPAIALLKDRMATATSPFVFPGKIADQPLRDIKHSWETISRKAGLALKTERRNRNKQIIKGRDGKPMIVWKPIIRLHDLRHSFASLLVNSGASLPMIGALLGHSQVQTTRRYSHLYDQPMRAAVEAVALKVTK